MTPLRTNGRASNSQGSLISTTPVKPSGSTASSSNQNNQNNNQNISINPRTPKIAAFARLNQQQQQQAAANNSQVVTPGGTRLVSGGLGSSTGQKLVVESSRYEEWMKIATDNKITSTNTWNLALIDYFHDMTLLRNSETDHSINFQKASCTLDGCVKIWTSRVDSVATATGKLLSGLAEDDSGVNRMDDEDGDEDGEDGDEGGNKKSKKTKSHAPSLATSFSKLKYKSLEQEFTVDPLFKKTSADFDEGGAGGILMNHLGCDGGMKVVFDAGDARLPVDEEDEVDGEGEKEEEDERDRLPVEVGKLMKLCLPAEFQSSLPSEYTLCPSLSSFHFSSSDLDILQNFQDDAPLQNDDAAQDDVWAGHEFGGGGDDDSAGGGGDGDDFFADLGQDTALNGAASPSPEYGVFGGDGNGEGDNGAGEIGAGGVTVGDDGEGEDGEGLEARLYGRNWAGPEHWKMRRVATRAATGKDTPAVTAKQRKEKAAFVLDFTVPLAMSAKEVFAPGTTSTISMPSTSATGGGRRKSGKKEKEDPESKKREEFVLPEDCGFGPERLLRLFLKPRTVLKLKRKNAPGRGGRASGGDASGIGGGDIGYIIDGVDGLGPMAIGAGMGMGGGIDMDDDDDDLGGMGDYDMPAPFQTQWLEDGDDDTPLGELLMQEEDDGGLAETLGQRPTRVRPDHVKYEKRAKRVDVKKLKDTIWKELEVVCVPVKEFPTNATYVPTSPTTPALDSSLIPVISSLRKSYPAEKMSEISTSFCFICLLHLANEKGLRIQTPGLMDEEGESGKRMRVGGLEGLKVFREIE